MRWAAISATLLWAALLRGQWSRTDSLRVIALNAECFAQADLDPVKAIALGQEALAMARRIGLQGGVAQAHAHMGYAYLRKSAFDTARVELNEAMRIYLLMGDTCDYAGVLHSKGLLLQAQQRQDSALACFMRVLALEERCKQQFNRSVRLFAIGSSYEAMQRFAEALDYYQQALSIDSARADSSRLAQEHIAVANMNSALGRYDNAIHHYEQSIAISSARGDGLMTGYINYNLGELAQGQGDLATAIKHASTSVELFTGLDRKAELAHASILLGSLHTLDGSGEEAERHLLVALRLADSLGLRDDRAAALYQLALASESQSDARGAMDWMKRYVAYDDSLKRQDRDARMAEMTTRFETEKKEQALALAEADAHKQRNMKLVYLVGASALALLLLVAVSRYRLKRRAAEELERVNAEVLRQKDRAEESERAKDRFLANVSHEIRTPLNAIMGFTGLLLHEHRDERTTRYLTNIREAGDNLLVVINDVLDLSRIEAGRLQLIKEPFDLHRTVRLCAEILLHRAEEQGNTFTTNVAQDVPQWVMGDSARVLQVLLNLAGNALKFTQGGTVEVGVRMAASGIRFVVRDNGIGIPQEKLRGIFDRFTQVDVNDQRKYGGTGLGLSIVKELVDLHGGTIHVHSASGQGTTFTVDLPLTATVAPANTAQRTVHASTGSLANRTILVAEDNDMNALVTTETLRRYYPAAQPVVVRTGLEALEHMVADADHDIALVLMDVQMPVMDGMTATRRIRALNGDAARVPIIALTASVLPSDLSRCLDAGMDACVPKPFKADELRRAIEQLTGDGGAPGGVGFDVHDPNVALYHWLVPQRLKALRAALAQGDANEVRNIVHALRPQLIEHDRATFDEPTARLLRDNDPHWKPNAQALVELVQTTLT